MTNPDEPTKEAPCRHFWSNPRSNGSKVCAWCGEIKPVNDSTMSAKQQKRIEEIATELADEFTRPGDLDRERHLEQNAYALTKLASDHDKQFESLKAELAEARAKLEAEKEASLHWVAKFTAAESLVGTLSSERLSLQSHNAKLVEALNLCKLMVENEIRGCELAGRSANAWPDLLTGCVSGGGINEALASQPDHELRDRVRAKLENYASIISGDTNFCNEIDDVRELLSSL